MRTISEHRSCWAISTCFLILASACSLGPVGSNTTAARTSARPEQPRRFEHIETLAREPMIAQLRDGTLFVTGYGEPRPMLWRSRDAGVTWSRVDVGGAADGAVGNSDVDLAVAPDGTLYFVAMSYDRKVYEGTGIAIGASRDGGVTWNWTALSNTRFDDRPWVEVAPDGTAHVVWNDGAGVSHAVSKDRGVTWRELSRVYTKGGSSHFVIGPNGELAVRLTPSSASANRFDEGVDLIALSLDGGSTWSTTTAPGTRDWSADFEAKGVTPRWVEPLAWDSAGRLYSLWTTKRGVHLARSADRGATWADWLVVSSDVQLFFPYLVATGGGELAATWFSQSDDDGSDLRWHFATMSEDGAAPRVKLGAARELESRRPREGKGDALSNDTGGEYLAMAALRNGRVAVVTPIQNSPKKRNGFTYWEFAD